MLDSFEWNFLLCISMSCLRATHRVCVRQRLGRTEHQINVQEKCKQPRIEPSLRVSTTIRIGLSRRSPVFEAVNH